MLTPSAAAISSVLTARANRGAERGVSPRTCKLPRALISMVPLPCLRAAAHKPANAASDMDSSGENRTSNPSPVGIGAQRPGQAPRRCGAFMLSPPR